MLAAPCVLFWDRKGYTDFQIGMVTAAFLFFCFFIQIIQESDFFSSSITHFQFVYPYFLNIMANTFTGINFSV